MIGHELDLDVVNLSAFRAELPVQPRPLLALFKGRRIIRDPEGVLAHTQDGWEGGISATWEICNLFKMPIFSNLPNGVTVRPERVFHEVNDVVRARRELVLDEVMLLEGALGVCPPHQIKVVAVTEHAR